jgi:hypothetical protein
LIGHWSLAATTRSRGTGLQSPGAEVLFNVLTSPQ